MPAASHVEPGPIRCMGLATTTRREHRCLYGMGMRRGLPVAVPQTGRSSRARGAAAACIAAVSLAASIVAAPPASAAAAKLGNYSSARSMAVQPNGRIVVAGPTQSCDPEEPFVPCANPAVVVVRYLPSGRIDRTFGGGDGLVRIPVGGKYISVENPGVSGLAIQDDGKIVVGAVIDIPFQSLPSLLLVRLRAKGKLDRGFGDRGKVVTSPDRFIASENGNGVVASPDGSILVAGSYDPPGPDIDFAAARYLSDGRLDPAFGAAGVASINVSEGLGGTLPYYETANAIGLRPDGRVLLGGGVSNGFVASFAVAQFDPSGQPDPSFGTGGHVVFAAFGAQFAGASAVGLEIGSEGDALFAGLRGGGEHPSCSKAVLARLSPGGTLVDGFGDAGLVQTAPPVCEGASDLELQGNRILIAGPGPDFLRRNRVVVVRYNDDGSVDRSFAGGAGVAVFKVAGFPGGAYDLAVVKGGRILTAGFVLAESCGLAGAKGKASDLCEAVALLRLQRNGLLDRTFGRGGIVTTPRIGR